ncbi:MAG: cation diffusion facilitator family transporter [Hymenobacteraceae bacterium]|nr:cation diffusion facilitator family transporter [Hymenobacteraceae bacterium]MDX5395302.1 cation diffusion facilitator family transporter [Hymenobacteraceae bacterium]MDX5511338.1 cation diffusion facilitator family transporter [Hymenobacteraceae bacterium]
MKKLQKFEFPDELVPVFKKARRLEWITIAYLISTAVLVYLTMGNSQAMKTAWFEDLISLTPSISFLVASRFITKEPNSQFPYGYHRVVSIAYLCSAVALFAVGCFLIFDSAMTLIKTEHATVGTVVLFGHQVWLGYLMIAAMVWGTIPAIILGRKKLPLAKKLHDKNLFTDAKMNKADWMTAAAAIFGILGIGLGWWWADAAAALVISVDILHDGFTNLKQAVFDLMDEVPKTVSKQKRDPLIDKVKESLSEKSWVKAVSIRLREEGHVYTGEGFVVPVSEQNLVQHIESAIEDVKKLDWRMQDFNIVPVKELKEED